MLAASPATPENMPGERFTRIFVSVDSGLVIALAFTFGLGNGWNTALRLGVNPLIAPLIQPAVDLAVVGLMVGLRYLAIHGWTDEQLAVPRRWLRFFGLLTLAMNTALPLAEHRLGRAAWDAIGPILLIAWSELAPWLLRAIYSLRQEDAAEPLGEEEPATAPPASAVAVRQNLTIIGTPEEVVETWLRHWSSSGKTYAEQPAAALRNLMKKQPLAVRMNRTVSDRWVGQLCAETWDRLYREGEVAVPRSA